jgi:predicted transcriptional regulator
MRAVARGDIGVAPLPTGPLLAALSPEAMELLGVLLRERPSSVAQVVALTGRAQSNVSRSLQHLARHRLIELVRDGREVRPVPLVASLVVDLATSTYEPVPLIKHGSGQSAHV